MSTYDEQEWVDGILGGTPLNDDRLTHIEAGIESAHLLLEGKADTGHTHLSADITDATSAATPSTIVERDASGFIAVSGITGLSSATSGTQPVPKSQFDSGLATKAAAAHTHLLAEVTDVTATGAALAAAVDVDAARDAIDVPSNADLATAVAAGVADAATAAESYTDAAVDAVIIPIVWAGGVWSMVRPNTTGTNKIVAWIGDSANPITYDGTTAGGFYKAAPSDLVIYR